MKLGNLPHTLNWLFIPSVPATTSPLKKRNTSMTTYSEHSVAKLPCHNVWKNVLKLEAPVVDKPSFSCFP